MKIPPGLLQLGSDKMWQTHASTKDSQSGANFLRSLGVSEAYITHFWGFLSHAILNVPVEDPLVGCFLDYVVSFLETVWNNSSFTIVGLLMFGLFLCGSWLYRRILAARPFIRLLVRAWHSAVCPACPGTLRGSVCDRIGAFFSTFGGPIIYGDGIRWMRLGWASNSCQRLAPWIGLSSPNQLRGQGLSRLGTAW